MRIEMASAELLCGEQRDDLSLVVIKRIAVAAGANLCPANILNARIFERLTARATVNLWDRGGIATKRAAAGGIITARRAIIFPLPELILCKLPVRRREPHLWRLVSDGIM